MRSQESQIGSRECEQESNHILLSNTSNRPQSCLLCGTVDDVLRGSADASDSRHRSNLTDDFVLGESDDDDEQPPPLDDEQPPAYNLDDVGTSSATEKENEAPTQASRDEKKRQDDQVQVHYIKPDETLLGLAMRYRVDVRRHLCA